MVRSGWGSVRLSPFLRRAASRRRWTSSSTPPTTWTRPRCTSWVATTAPTTPALVRQRTVKGGRGRAASTRVAQGAFPRTSTGRSCRAVRLRTIRASPRPLRPPEGAPVPPGQPRLRSEGRPGKVQARGQRRAPRAGLGDRQGPPRPPRWRGVRLKPPRLSPPSLAFSWEGMPLVGHIFWKQSIFLLARRLFPRPPPRGIVHPPRAQALFPPSRPLEEGGREAPRGLSSRSTRGVG